MSTDDGLRICSPWFDSHHCSCSLEQGTLLPLLQSAAWTITPHLSCVVILVTFPRGTPETLGRNKRLNFKKQQLNLKVN